MGKDWFPTFVGMVRGEKVTSLRGGEGEEGLDPSSTP
jgi:hypothetical protein